MAHNILGHFKTIRGTNNINLLDCLNASNIAKFAFYASIAKLAFYQLNSPAIDTLMFSQCPGQLPLTILNHVLFPNAIFPHAVPSC